MENHQIQFILKSMLGLSLAAIICLSSILPSASCSPIQNQQGSSEAFKQIHSNTNAFQPIASAQFQQQPQAFAGNTSEQKAQPSQEQIYKTYNPSFVTNFQQLTKSGAEIVNIRPTRRTILSTLMAPFVSMREQAMNMLGASLQGCNSGTQSMWCRFWGMFLK